MELIYTAIAFFSAAALLGIYLLLLVLRGKETSKSIAIAHGLMAATALVLLIIHTVRTETDTIEIVVLFVIAALAGIVLFSRDIRGKSLPKPLAIVHGLLAVSAFIFLLLYAFDW